MRRAIRNALAGVSLLGLAACSSGEPGEVIRTPDERFEGLSWFDYEPQYSEIAGLRIQYVDEAASRFKAPFTLRRGTARSLGAHGAQARAPGPGRTRGARGGQRVPRRAPPEVAALFEALVARLGLEAMLDHAIATWLEAGARFEDHADFERDGFRCTVPGCTARRNLQSHHIWFRSACGPDVAWNRTTLCAYHHHRGVHAGRLALRRRAPDGLIYELGVGRFRSGDVIAST
jgi:hypothetical protein